MSETRPVRRFRLLYPGVILAGLVLLGFILPMIPQPGLQQRLVERMRQAAYGSLRTGEVRLQIFPRPGIVVRDVSLASPSLKLDIDRLELDFSLLSLLFFKPEIAVLQLAGGTVKSSVARSETLALLETGVAPLFPGTTVSRVSFAALTVRTPSLPGINNPLVFAELEGEWSKLAGRGNESLELTAVCNGGRLQLKTVWYNDDTVSDNTGSGRDAAPSEEARGVEIKARLTDAELHFSSDFKDKYVDRGFTELVCRHSDLQLDVNGSVADGLRFSLDGKTPEHSLTTFDANGETRRRISQGPLELKGSGYFQPQAGYLNLKSAALVLPGPAVVYTRGLVRFREPFFVDLVSHLKVDDLEMGSRCFAASLPDGFKARGELTGDLKLVGNLFDMPVLKAEMQAGKIEVETGSGTGTELSSLNSLLDFLAGWEWLADCDCRIDSLQWNDLGMKNFILTAKKKTTQFEIERLAAEFKSQGRARLTLIVDDLLDNPRWQASLVAKGIDPSRLNFGTGFPSARLNFSLVGGGSCGAGVDYLKAAEFDGKWSLRQGKFTRQPLFTAFNRFLGAAGRKPWPGDFSGSGKAVFRKSSLGLTDVILKFPGRRQISGRGSCSFSPSRLNFRGRLKEKGYQAPFVLQGTLESPLFSASGR